MLNVKLICLGRLKEKYLRDACDEYRKRLRAFCNFEELELPAQQLPDNPSPAQIEAALEAEAKLVAAKIPSGAAVVAMCIEGKQLPSQGLAKALSGFAVNGSSCVVFVIGSSYGISEKIKTGAAMRLSMSEMTFPHQLARVMLMEQIYRAFQINSGGKYHK